MAVARRTARLSPWLISRLASSWTSRFVHRFGQFVAGGFKLRGGLIDEVYATLGHGLLGFFERFLYRLGVGRVNFVPMLLQHLLDVVNHRIGAVARLDLLFLLAIVARMRFGVPRHFLHFVLAQARRGGDGDLLLVVGGFVFGRYVQDSVRVDIKSHLHLWNAARSRRDGKL